MYNYYGYQTQTCISKCGCRSLVCRHHHSLTGSFQLRTNHRSNPIRWKRQRVGRDCQNSSGDESILRPRYSGPIYTSIQWFEASVLCLCVRESTGNWSEACGWNGYLYHTDASRTDRYRSRSALNCSGHFAFHHFHLPHCALIIKGSLLYIISRACIMVPMMLWILHSSWSLRTLSSSSITSIFHPYKLSCPSVSSFPSCFCQAQTCISKWRCQKLVCIRHHHSLTGSFQLRTNYRSNPIRWKRHSVGRGFHNSSGDEIHPLY